MEILCWTLTITLVLLGLIGSIVPFIPGPALIFAAAILHRLLSNTGTSPGWGIIAILGLLMLVCYAVDFISGAAGAKYFGSSRWGAIGGILGAIVGVFFGIPGLFLGPMIGALGGELLGGKGILPAGQSGIGTLIGTTAGLLAKVLIALLMTGLFALALLLHW